MLHESLQFAKNLFHYMYTSHGRRIIIAIDEFCVMLRDSEGKLGRRIFSQGLEFTLQVVECNKRYKVQNTRCTLQVRGYTIHGYRQE